MRPTACPSATWSMAMPRSRQAASCAYISSARRRAATVVSGSADMALQAGGGRRGLQGARELGGGPLSGADRALHQPEEFGADLGAGPVHAPVRHGQVRAEREPVARAEQRGVATAAVRVADPVGHVEAGRLGQSREQAGYLGEDGLAASWVVQQRELAGGP